MSESVCACCSASNILCPESCELYNTDLLVKVKLGIGAILPTRATEGSSGWDIYAAESLCLGYLKASKVKTGLFIELPKGWELTIRPRSSLSLEGVIVPNSPCTIDSDYRGEILVPLLSILHISFRIEAGQRIAQGVFKKVYTPTFKITESLSETKRGIGGFGSTGT